MAENGTTREMVESVVSAVFDAEATRLRDEVVRRVMLQLNAGAQIAVDTSATARLQQTATEIEQAGSQSDILHALLEGASSFAARAVVFLLRGNSAVGWQARGFGANDALKLLNVDMGSGLAAQAAVRRSPVFGKTAEFDARLVAECGTPFDANCLLVPLTVRDKVVALLYADAGTEPGALLDPHALQLLSRLAGIWLELLALRKTSGTAVLPGVSQPVESSEPTPTTSVTQDVQAETPAVAPEPAPQPVSVASVLGDEELHRKARRFARLLVEEIKLYNLPKVRDGKLHRNLYDRLKDDIEKSRATYDQRYASTPVAAADYFTQELVRGLADGDAGLFGSNFPR